MLMNASLKVLQIVTLILKSPESDFEESISKADPLGVLSNDGKPVARQQSDSSADSFIQSSFEGDVEVQESKELQLSDGVNDSEGAEASLEKNTKLKKQTLSASKQSLNEELLEKSLLTPGTTERKSESAPSSPLSKPLGLSSKHGAKRKIFSVIERLAKSNGLRKQQKLAL